MMLRIFFRSLEPDDYKVSIDWRRDPDIWASVVGRRRFVSAENERQWVQRQIEGGPDFETFAVCLKDDGSYIGNAYIQNIDYFNRSCSTARLIGCRDQRKKGIGTEISYLLLCHAFYELGLERAWSRQLTTNTASIRSLEKCGYKNEGIARKAALKNGSLVDLNLMGCLREDFEAIWTGVD